MSTSRKVKAKLAKQRRSARKATSTEAAQKEPEPEPPSVPPPRRGPPPRGEQSPPALRSQVLNLFAFATGCQAKNYLQDSVCSLAHFRADARPVGHTEADNAGNLSGPPARVTETFLGSRHGRSVVLKI